MSLLRSSAFRLLLLTLPALGAFAQANPDMRPYRAVEQQQLRANVQIILDSSLNMKKDMGANTPLAAEASTGSWVCVSGTNAQIGCSGGSPATIKSRYSYAGPSREAIIKNLLGNSVSLVDFPSGTTNVSGCVSNPTCTGAIAPAAPSGAINTLAPADLLYKTLS